MKRIFILSIAILISAGLYAQGNSQGKGNKGNKSAKIKGNKGASSAGGNSKNQPSKVSAAFAADYPNASNVVWNKYRGDWTATFNNGAWRSTAVYHANGQRKDTRTEIQRNQLPGTIWDRIFSRDRVTPVGNIVQIESPSLKSELFRIATQAAGAGLQYYFYNRNGQRVQYDY
jgi:hypothetical protein